MFRNGALTIIFVMMGAVLFSGCAVNFYRQSPGTRQTIETLQEKVQDLEAKRQAERAHFEEVKSMLESRLRKEISDKTVSLQMQDGGLAIVLSDDILFDSGRAEIKEDAHSVLDKVSRIVTEEVPEKDVGIAGHTDNVPIRVSGWDSNWELSTARATSVLHHMVDRGVLPGRLSATGYGEHRPIASNDTAEGRRKNRRVEIIILPEFVRKRPEEVPSVIK